MTTTTQARSDSPHGGGDQMPSLVLPLKGVYFDEIVAGTKPQEFRLCTPYWAKRLEGRSYGAVTITKGYPAASDTERRRTYPWRGFERKTITHPFFGTEPVEVYAINVGEPAYE